jgi:hypothetical protein
MCDSAISALSKFLDVVPGCSLEVRDLASGIPT